MLTVSRLQAFRERRLKEPWNRGKTENKPLLKTDESVERQTGEKYRFAD